MIRFESDYTQGAVPEIIERLVETNLEQTPGYGTDKYCLCAADKIRKEIGDETADVHFLVGGTQTNYTFICSALRPHQAVICAETGHIFVHESGSVEATGHKVIALPSADGKITAEQIEALVNAHRADENFEHTVQPKLVYISFPTENGTIYSKNELESISEVCKEKDLILFLDGARLGYGLASPENDLTFADIARLTDAFYIGGTKVGALFGEALVITNNSLKSDFRYIEKQKGAMLAKGRLLGLQFDTLFTDGLYMNISRHAASLAVKIREAFIEKGIDFLYDSYTNQQFPILTKEQKEILDKDFVSSFWCEKDGKIAVRFCTSWATPEEDVQFLIEKIKTL